MDFLNDLIAPKEDIKNITGTWCIARWVPDIATGEILNVGVMFLGNNGEMEMRFLDDYSRIECLYNSSHAPFHAELCQKVAKATFLEDPTKRGVISPNLIIEDRGFAQGENPEIIISRLFSSVITLAQPRIKKGRKDPFQSLSRELAYSKIKQSLIEDLGLHFSEYIPSNPFYNFKDRYGEEKLYLPFQKDKVKGKYQSKATLSSAAYADPWRVKSNLYEGFKNVETALNNELIENAAIFIALPGDGLDKLVNENINDEIETFYNFSKRHGIPIYSHMEPEQLAHDASKWMNIAA